MSDDFIVMLIYFALKQHFVEYSSTIFPTAHACIYADLFIKGYLASFTQTWQKTKAD